jgi:hypothetical protein
MSGLVSASHSTTRGSRAVMPLTLNVAIFMAAMMHRRVGQLRRPDAPASAKPSGRWPDACCRPAPNTVRLSSSRFRELRIRRNLK